MSSNTNEDSVRELSLAPGEKELTINLSFASEARSTPIAYVDLPADIQSELDDFASALFDPESGRVMVTGNPMVGKTFLIEQLFFNSARYTELSGMPPAVFIKIAQQDAVLIEESLAGGWSTFVELCENQTKAAREQLVFVTEAVEAAAGLSPLRVKVIYELSLSTLAHLNHHEDSGLVKLWSAWDTVDANLVLLTKADLTKTLALNLLDRINIHYPDLNMKRHQIHNFISYAVDAGELKLTPELEQIYQKKSGAIGVPPGIWARAISRLAAAMVLNGRLKNGSGNLVFTRAVAKIYGDFEGQFQEFVELFDAVHDDETDAMMEAIRRVLPNAQVVQRFQLGELEALDEDDEEAEVSTASQPMAYSDFATLPSRLKAEVIGQDEAIDSVIESLKIPAAGLHLETRPLRSFLFLGPTGVGKTQLATTLAQELTAEPLPLKRFDMSEYGREHEVAKLIGAPPGYLGHDGGGALTKYVKENPQAVLIFDEIEKAHPKVWDTFLQILDAGRLTSNRGETIDFTQTIVVMTSNLGASDLARPSVGFGIGTDAELEAIKKSEASKIVMSAVEREFRPELVNRIDQMVVFNKLSDGVIQAVVEKELRLLAARIEKQGYSLAPLSVDILTRLAELSDVSKYGAREIQRVVGKAVSALLANAVLTKSEVKEISLKLNDDKTIGVA